MRGVRKTSVPAALRVDAQPRHALRVEKRRRACLEQHRDRRYAACDDRERGRHRNGLPRRHRPTGTRVDDVAVAPPVDLEVALVVAGRGDGTLRPVPPTRSPPTPFARMLDADPPRRAVRLAADHANVTAQVDERVRDAMLLQDVAARSAAYSLPMPPKSSCMPSLEGARCRRASGRVAIRRAEQRPRSRASGTRGGQPGSPRPAAGRRT